MKKKVITTLLVLLLVSIAGGAYYAFRGQRKPPEVTTAPVTRGDVIDTVGATGTIEAVTTVQVGSQVSGTVEGLYADFNSIVRKGQVIARLNPSLFQTQIEQARANLLRAEADVDRLRVGVEDAQIKLNRARQLAKEQLIAQQDLEAAELTLKSAQAQLQSSLAQVTQARATLNQNEVNLEHTVITAPIDGIVISRNVDVGQTVAASFQAPVLFILAADLTAMQVKANVDEADAGRIRPGQAVRFRVDAFPNEEFTGQVSQLRLQPTVVQNVVTYTTVIDVPNRELKLKPGMTANVSIEIARRENVVRVPVAALRFRPTPEMFAAFNQPVPEELQRGRGGNPANASSGSAPGAGQRSASQGGAAVAPSAQAPAPSQRAAANPGGTPGAQSPAQPSAPSARVPRGNPGGTRAGADGSGQAAAAGAPGERMGRGEAGREGAAEREAGQGGNPEERRQRFLARLEQMSPEERARAMQRMRERGFDPTARGEGAGRAPADAQAAPATAAPAQGRRPASAATGDHLANTGAQTIDSLFGPLPTVETRGRAWLFGNGQLKPLRLRLGVSDGNFTEVLNEEVTPGMEVVTGITLDTPQTTSSSPVRSPFTPQRGGPPGRR